MATANSYIQGIFTEPFVFPASSTVSNVVSTSGGTLSELCFSTAFTSATISFIVSPDGVNFYTLTDGSTGLAFSLIAAPATAVPASLLFTNGFRYYQLVSSVTQTNKNIVQGQFIPLVNKEWN